MPARAWPGVTCAPTAAWSTTASTGGRSAGCSASPARTRRLIAGFLAITVIDAAMVVVIPLLVQRIVDDGILKGDRGLVTWLARRHGRRRGLQRPAQHPRRLAVQPDRRGADLRPPHPGLRPRAAPVAGLLHPHPDRRAGLPAQQRRHRRPARLHLDPVQHRRQHHRRRGRGRHDARAQLAGDPALPGAVPAAPPGQPVRQQPAGRPDPPPDGRQRRPRQRDDRAVQRRRRDAAQAVRPPRRGGRPVRREGRGGPRPRRPDLAGHAHLRGRDDAGPRAGHRARLRRRRPARDQQQPHRRHHARARHPAAPAARPAPGALQRPDRRDDRAGQLRAGLRGARPAVA